MYGEEAKSNQSNTFAVSGMNKSESDVPRIARQMGTIQKQIAENRELVATLEQRLSAVLRPAGPESGEVVGSPVPRNAPSPMLGDLEEFELGLSGLSRRVTDILNRLEV